MSREPLIRSALDVWAPDWPRNVTQHQRTAVDQDDAAAYLMEAESQHGNEPFISTYSFPRGHTKHDEIPEINTLFIDFDFDEGEYERGSGDIGAWRRDLSHLLVRVRIVAQHLVENGNSGWRAALSGHKGVHLFLDFPTIDPEIASFRQYVTGINRYANELVDQLADVTGIDDLASYVDVTSSDLGRLCRVPNTKHGGASASFNEARYCVPVSLEELAELTPARYLRMTRNPRPPPQSEREPNETAGHVIQNYVASATSTGSDTRYSPSSVSWERVDEYRERSNDNIALADVKFLTSDRPCVWEFYKRDDKFEHGDQSHYMEVFCIRELLEHDVPISVIKDFLDSAPQYDDEYSERMIKQIISRDYHRFAVSTVLERAPEFMATDGCSLCQRVIADNPHLQDIYD